LIELLDEAGQTHYYDGCVVVELKDHRHSVNGYAHTSRKVLLAPSMESLVYDIDVLGKSVDGGMGGDFIRIGHDLILSLQGVLPRALMTSLHLSSVYCMLQLFPFVWIPALLYSLLSTTNILML
jgi:hypothetical protein